MKQTNFAMKYDAVNTAVLRDLCTRAQLPIPDAFSARFEVALVSNDELRDLRTRAHARAMTRTIATVTHAHPALAFASKVAFVITAHLVAVYAMMKKLS